MSIKGQHIDEYFEEDPPPNAGQAVLAVFELLSKKIAAGEIEQVRGALPDDLSHFPFAFSLSSSGSLFCATWSVFA